MSSAVAGRETRLRIVDRSNFGLDSVVGGEYGFVNCVNARDQFLFGERLR